MTGHPVPQPRSRQAGLGLVELMVALAIALFMTAGIIASFMATKRTFESQERLSALQDNERLAMQLLTASVQAAGYYPDPAAGGAQDALPAGSAGGASFAAGQGITGTGDTLATRYVLGPGEPLADCLGQTNRTPAPVLVVNTYRVGSNGDLLCSLDGGATSTTLVGKVHSMTALYGTDALGDGGVDRYLRADELNAAGLWPQVRSVRLTVCFLNPYAGEPGQPATIDWIQIVSLMNRT